MIRALLSIILVSAAAFTWAAVDNDGLSVPVRMWALIVFMFQVVSLVSVWRKK